MSKIVLLDAGPLGLLANPNTKPRIVACKQWATRIRRLDVRIAVPALADFEVRRGLTLHRDLGGIQMLDNLIETYGYLEPTPRAIDFAATLWADARRGGRAVAPDVDLHADVILAGQALELEAEGYDAWIATDNLRHLQALFTRAELWEKIGPA